MSTGMIFLMLFLMYHNELIIDLIDAVITGKINKTDIPEKIINSIGIGASDYTLEDEIFHTLKHKCNEFISLLS